MQHEATIEQFRKTVDLLISKKVMTKSKVMKDVGLDYYKFNEILQKPMAEITLKASTLGKIQDFNKRHVTIHTYPELSGKIPETKPPVSRPAVRAKKPAPLKKEVQKAAAEANTQKADEQAKKNIDDFMERITRLCEDHKPPNVEVSVTIK